MADVILDELLSECVARGGTALFIYPDQPPRIVTSGTSEPVRPDALSVLGAHDLLLGCLSDKQREVLQVQRRTAFDHSLVMVDGTVVRFCCLISLSDVGVIGAFTLRDAPGRLFARSDEVGDVLRPVLERMDRRYQDAGWDLPTEGNERDLPRPGGEGGSGGAPVPAPLGPRRPLRSGHDAKPIPRDDRGDDNPAAQ